VLADAGFVPVDSQLVTSVTPLAGISLARIRNGHRRNVVFAAQHAVAIEEDNSVAALKAFRRLHLIESRRLGNPQAGWRFLEHLQRLAPSRYRLLLARHGDTLLGGLLTIDDGRTVFGRYGAYGSPEARRLYVGKALLWRALSDAAGRGCQWFDWGISWYRDTGLIHSKEGWNATSRPVHLSVLPLRAQPPAPGGYIEGFALAKAVWRRLQLPLVDWVGHRVTRWVC
jgi:hypothetical protein